MKWMMIIAVFALAGCQETESKYAGHWESKYGEAEIKITADSCRWYMGDGYGVNCEIEGDTLLVKKGNSFSESKLTLIIDKMYVFPPTGMQVYKLVSRGDKG